jgi:NAD-dependent deacetylase
MGLRQSKGLRLGRYQEVYFLTGAGVSVGSGLSQYRADGRTLSPELAEVLDGERLPGSLPQLWAWAQGLASTVAAATPNEAHFAIGAARRALAERGKSSTLATMNVDGLHQRAGDEDALELHGSVLRVRCTVCESSSHPKMLSFAGVEASPPSCLECGAALRPDIVLYHEQPDTYATWQSKRALRDADLIVIVGTSARVTTVDTVMRAARFTGARTVGINLSKDGDPGYTEFHQGRAEDVLPELLTL